MIPLFASSAGAGVRPVQPSAVLRNGFPPRKRSGRPFDVVPAWPVQLRYASGWRFAPSPPAAPTPPRIVARIEGGMA